MYCTIALVRHTGASLVKPLEDLEAQITLQSTRYALRFCNAKRNSCRPLAACFHRWWQAVQK